MKHFLQLTPGDFPQTQPGYPHLGVFIGSRPSRDRGASGWTGVALLCTDVRAVEMIGRANANFRIHSPLSVCHQRTFPGARDHYNPPG